MRSVSSQTSDNPEVSGAERLFREAFARLKADSPVVLPRGTPVSQNNVAKEAGRDPSALRKTRYPSLIADIQASIEEHGPSPASSARKKTLVKRRNNRSLEITIEDLKRQRDNALSLLVEADAKIVDLTMELSRLQAHLNAAAVNPLGRGSRFGEREAPFRPTPRRAE